MKDMNITTSLTTNGCTKKPLTPKTSRPTAKKTFTPIATRSKTKKVQINCDSNTDSVKKLNQKPNSTLSSVVKTNSSVQTEMSYSELIDIDTDVLDRITYLTQQNENLVKNTTELQNCYDKKILNFQSNLEKTVKDRDLVKSNYKSREQILKEEVSSLTAIIQMNEQDTLDKTKILENQIIKLKEEILYLKDRIEFVESTPGPSRYVSRPKLITKDPIKVSNRFEILCNLDEENLPMEKSNCFPKIHQKNKLEKLQSNNYVKNDITVIGDSHCRNIARYLKEESQGTLTTHGMCMPNAGILSVAESLNGTGLTSSLGDCLVIVAGANDIYNGQAQNIYKHYRTKLLRNEEQLKLIVSIPLRRDLPLSHPINEQIIDVNIFLSDTSHALKNSTFIDVTVFPKSYTSKDGIHLNNKGKAALSKLIHRQHSLFFLGSGSKNPNTKSNQESRRQMSQSTPQWQSTGPPPQRQTISPPPQWQSTNPPPQRQTTSPPPQWQSTSQPMSHERHRQTSSPPQQQHITVIEGNMKDMISQFHGDSKTAFSHCVSSDFGAEKNMSAGVAVIFRKVFGRPTTTDIITNHLAYQDSLKNAKVYSLITKLQYFQKPTKKDYNTAFSDLTKDFKKRGFSHLVCSPMGCMRDQISIDHFANNLCQFQQSTKANIDIVVYKDPRSSAKTYKNGLTHEQFVKHLKSQISAQQHHLNDQLKRDFSSCPPLESMCEYPPLPGHYSEDMQLPSRELTNQSVDQSNLPEGNSRQSSTVVCDRSTSDYFLGWKTPIHELKKLSRFNSVIFSDVANLSFSSSPTPVFPQMPQTTLDDNFLLLTPRILTKT